MTRRTALVCLILLTGCAPTTPDGGAPPGPPDRGGDGDPNVIHCTTAAWDIGDTRPVAMEIDLDRAGFSADLRLDRAHQYDSEDPFDFTPSTWTSQATFEVGDALAIELDGVTIAGDRMAFADPMWAGTLESDEHGVQPAICWQDGFVPDFSYEGESGRCLDEDGNQGLNALPVPYLRSTGDGQCGTFAGLSLNEDWLSYPVLTADLRGAVLDGATLSFAHILDSQWEGADLTGFQFGYAYLTGSTDVHTVWPEESCSVTYGALDCAR